MNSFRFRMTMGLFTIAGMLACLAGCPSKQTQTQTVNNTTPPPHVLVKADLEGLKGAYSRRLSPANGFVTESKELKLVNFFDPKDRAFQEFEALRNDVKRMIESKIHAPVRIEQRDGWSFVVLYDHKSVHGKVFGQLKPHEGQHDRWNIELRVEEKIY